MIQALQKGPSIIRRLVSIEKSRDLHTIAVSINCPKRTRHITHTHCIRRIQIRRRINIQKTVLTVLLPKWDNVTNYVIYLLIWPFQGNSQHCIEILTTQSISNFGLDKILHIKSTLTCRNRNISIAHELTLQE